MIRLYRFILLSVEEWILYLFEILYLNELSNFFIRVFLRNQVKYVNKFLFVKTNFYENNLRKYRGV